MPDDFMRVGRQSMWLKCSECGIIKNGIHDMEVHMKTEHLNWLPYKCTNCGSQRATPSQMREHLHSSHRSNNSSFLFEDNSDACSRLGELMDDTIRSSLIPKSSTKKNEEDNSELVMQSGEKFDVKSQIETSLPPTPTATPSPDDENFLARKRLRTVISADATPSSSYSAVTALLANATQTERADEVIRKKVKEEEPEEEDDKTEDNEAIAVDPSFTAYLSGLGVLMNGLESIEREAEEVEQMKEVKVKKTRSLVVKYCSKCNKGIKSNEKGAHVSYHLSKDFKMNRFQCMIGGCKQENYRKVNIANHQLKVHGLSMVDHSLINDRQHEMAHIYQAQLVELFGANDAEDGMGEANVQAVKEVV